MHEESVIEEIAIIAESRATGQETVASLETKMPASLVENRAILPRIVRPQDLVGKAWLSWNVREAAIEAIFGIVITVMVMEGETNMIILPMMIMEDEVATQIAMVHLMILTEIPTPTEVTMAIVVPALALQDIEVAVAMVVLLHEAVIMVAHHLQEAVAHHEDILRPPTSNRRCPPQCNREDTNGSLIDTHVSTCVIHAGSLRR